MSDNDLIRRGDVINVIHGMHVGGRDAIEHALPNTYAADLREIVYEVDDIPAVPHEMSAREFIYAFQKMCKNIQCCPKCPLYGLVCGKLDTPISDIEEAVAIVEKWAHEHPEERSESDE